MEHTSGDGKGLGGGERQGSQAVDGYQGRRIVLWAEAGVGGAARDSPSHATISQGALTLK